jgi:radical SAM/Cys-rich protein
MSQKPQNIQTFDQRLSQIGLELNRDKPHTLQINVGVLCNQTCKHCHHSAGPDREEIMSKDTMTHIIAYAQNVHFDEIDITGGATELNPHINYLLQHLAPLTPKLMLRTNLTALTWEKRKELMERCKALKVVIVASFPSTDESQTRDQRGENVFHESLKTLKLLNELGYGKEDTDLELDLVSNPAGAFLPMNQCKAEKKFKRDLARKCGLSFDKLFTFANVPLGRFREWLIESGNYEDYIKKLADAFNPETIDGLMCRTLMSVSWDGYLYDCDFNLAKGLFMGNQKTHISQLNDIPGEGTPIVTGEHCYACTAGTGFT